MQGNNEDLNIRSSSFDVYIANFSVHLVGNHQNQINEAFRLLKKGGKAGFSVWGWPENASWFTFLPSIFEKYGI